jgi:transcriptional regulator with XRE-family HTH domain
MIRDGEGVTSASTELGSELRRIRRTRGDTLRVVEDATGISNAYLSQLETGKISKPSPNFLYKLAEFYEVPYGLLMERAGYVGREGMKNEESHRRLSAAALAAISGLTPQEEEELMNFAEYLRSRRSMGRS